MKIKYITYIIVLTIFLLGFKKQILAKENNGDTVLVTFMADVNTVIRQEEVKKGSKIVFPESPTEEDGYIFDGWTMRPANADVNNIQTDVTFMQKWKKTVMYDDNYPIDPDFQQKEQKLEEQQKEIEQYISISNNTSKELESIKPKLSYDKKKKKLKIKTDKKITHVTVYYSKNKNFNKLNSAEFELKNGKATISLKKLKKLKKKKTYYVKVVGVLKQELYGREMSNYTKVSKIVKVKNK